MRKFITFLSFMIVALNTNALGLSHIQVYSKLNEPLNSKINILSIPKGKSNVVKVNLASARAFRRAGLDRPFILTKINFTVRKINKTSAVINVSSRQSIKEPFLNFLVEVSWPGGRILREYTVLLDPPLYKPISAKKLIVRDTQLAVKPKYTPIQNRIKPKKRVTKKRVVKKRITKKRVTPKSVKSGSYTVFKNDTLSQIAQRTRPRGVSLDKQMRKIYRTNPRAFINGNKNRIKRGKVLKIPDWDGKLTKDELAQIAQNSRTNTEITTKNTSKAPESSLVKESISNKRLNTAPKLLLSTPKTDAKDTKEFRSLRQEVINLTEKNSSIESENKVLKKDIAATKGLVTNMKQQLDEMNNMLLAFKSEGFAKLQSQLAKQAEENKRLKNQLANLKEDSPKVIEDNKFTFKPTARLPSLDEHDKTIVKPEQTVASAETITESSDDEYKVVTDEDLAKNIESESINAPETSGKTIRVKNIESDEPDFITMLDKLVKENVTGGWITVIAIIGAIILLIIILIVVKKRKPKSNEPVEWKTTKLSDEEIEIELSRLDEESETSNLSESNILDDIEKTTSGEDTDAKFEVDPKFDKDLREEVAQYTVAEKYSLAEDLIESAIRKYPHHHKYRLELLEVYADAKEIDKFEEQAQLLHNEIDGKGPLWDETLELWKYLSPNKELSITNTDTKDDNGNSGNGMVAAAAGVAVGAGIAAVALSEDDEPDEIDLNSEDDIDGGASLDLGDDLDLNLDSETEEELDLSNDSNEEFDLNLDSENELDLGDTDDSMEELSLEDDDELSLDDLGDTDDSMEELSLEDDDELSLDDLGDTDDSMEELSLDDDELSLDDLGDTDDSMEELSLEDDDELSLDDLGDTDDSMEELSLEDDDELSLDDLGDTDDSMEELSLEDDDELSLDDLGDTDDSMEELSLEDDDELSLDDLGDTDDSMEELSLEDDDELSLDDLGDTDDSMEELSLEDDDELSLDDLGDTDDSMEELSLEDDDELSLDDLGDTDDSMEELSLEDDDLSLDDLGDTDDSMEELSLDDEDLSLDDLGDTDDSMEELSLEDDDLSLDDLGDTDDDLDSLLNQLDTGEIPDDMEIDEESSGDEISSQFDLAQMYIDMDDNDNARGILEEIIQKGDEEQQQKAQSMIANI